MATGFPTTRDRAARHSRWPLMVAPVLAATFLSGQPLHAQDDWRHGGATPATSATRR